MTRSRDPRRCSAQRIPDRLLGIGTSTFGHHRWNGAANRANTQQVFDAIDQAGR